MIKTPNFQVRKRKRKTKDVVKPTNGFENFEVNDVGDSRRRPRLCLDDDVAGDYYYYCCCCCCSDERDENPVIINDDVDIKFLGLDDDVAGRDGNPVDDVVRRFRGSGMGNPRLGLGLDDDVAGRDGNNPVNDVVRRFRGFGMENPRLGLGLDDDVAVEEVKEEDEGDDVDKSLKSELMVVSERKKDGGDAPPDDDCCPICFDSFSIACKTNCGHWFCANCILQFWTYRTVLKKCNCPICARPISKLTPEAALLMMHEVEVVEVLKNVQRYNRLFQGGINGVIRKAFEVPNLFKRMLRGLMDPDRFRGNYYAMRSFALLMSCIYNIGSFDFIPTGTLGVRRLFDLCAIALVVILCLVGICHRLVLRQRVRRLAAYQL